MTDGDGLSDDVDGAPCIPAPRMHVDPGAPAGGDVLSWETAYTDLASAIQDAKARSISSNPEDDVAEIWVAAGTYTFEATSSSGSSPVAFTR